MQVIDFELDRTTDLFGLGWHRSLPPEVTTYRRRRKSDVGETVVAFEALLCFILSIKMTCRNDETTYIVCSSRLVNLISQIDHGQLIDSVAGVYCNQNATYLQKHFEVDHG